MAYKGIFISKENKNKNLKKHGWTLEKKYKNRDRQQNENLKRYGPASLLMVSEPGMRKLGHQNLNQKGYKIRADFLSPLFPNMTSTAR